MQMERVLSCRGFKDGSQAEGACDPLRAVFSVIAPAQVAPKQFNEAVRMGAFAYAYRYLPVN